MTDDFYDKVAKKFGGYAYGTNNPIMIRESPNGDPEKVFKQKLLDLAGKNKKALDVGCGDCKFAFEIADKYSEIIGIDTSKELLEIAKAKKEEKKNQNVSFLLQNASKTEFRDESFDIIFCRRGPTYFNEYYRILKQDGYYIEIGIGEKDSKDIKEVFGRGQDFRRWEDKKTRLQKDSEEMEKFGFKITFAQDYFYKEYYKTIDDLNIFLQGVPIFEDYGLENDRGYLEEYAKKFKTEKGISLPRHRIVFIGQKA